MEKKNVRCFQIFIHDFCVACHYRHDWINWAFHSKEIMEWLIWFSYRRTHVLSIHTFASIFCNGQFISYENNKMIKYLFSSCTYCTCKNYPCWASISLRHNEQSFGLNGKKKCDSKKMLKVCTKQQLLSVITFRLITSKRYRVDLDWLGLASIYRCHHSRCHRLRRRIQG